MKLTLNSALLAVISLVKQKKELAITESILGLSADWYADTRNTFFSLPDELILSVNLKKNEYCFRAIEALDIPKEWMTTESHELYKFEFNY
jgi:hypothetical protein